MLLKRIAAISAMNKLKLFLFLPIMASAMVPAYSAFSAPAPIDAAPIDAGDTGDTAERARNCEARFEANGQLTGWIGLGRVGGFLSFDNKKKECLKKAKDYVPNLNFSNFGLTGQQVCDRGGKVTVYIDTQVDGKGNSRDGEVQNELQTKCEQKCTSTYVP
jgi:hypothetical protein